MLIVSVRVVPVAVIMAVIVAAVGVIMIVAVFMCMFMIVRVVMAAVGMIMAMLVSMFVAVVMVAMLVAMPVIMLMIVLMIVRMGMTVVMPMPVLIHLLRQCVILGVGFVMAMLVAAAVGAGFGLEGRFDLDDFQAQAQQQIAQYGIEFQLQVIRAYFDRRVPIAQVIGGTQQDMRIDTGRTQHRLGRGDHADEAAIFCNQRIAVTQYRAARQE